ncbi:MAG: efflux RND transporter periplasmic adaptor subunit [Acidihalobacter sp.]|uniref:efflux RND transporter periplasmic adaptor subunit n=1 Tax=Acidihalobacter sp. TaxID=1872108 RepID=UPI00307E0EEC
MRNRVVLGLLPLLAVVLSACGQHNGQQRGGREGQELAVQVVRPTIETVPVTTMAAGTMSSPHSVTIAAQVTARLDKVWVHSGQMVSKGQRLFSLDSASYRAALLEAEAKLKGDEAQARYSAGQVESLKPLVAKQYVTRQTYDQAVATAQADRAQVEQDRAAIETAKLNLAYTTLRAPIAGRLGVIALQPGNMVQANSTDLVTLKQMSPLLVNFALPQSMLSQVLALPKSGNKGSLEVLHEDATQVIGKGHLTVVDNGVSSSTGTISLQGQVDNANGKLWPGQFVTVRLRLGSLQDALVVPGGAVQPGQDGNFVYLVKSGKAVVQPVTVALTTADKAVIGKGVKSGDEVIYPLPARIRPNAPVRVLQADGQGSASGAGNKPNGAARP